MIATSAQQAEPQPATSSSPAVPEEVVGAAAAPEIMNSMDIGGMKNNSAEGGEAQQIIPQHLDNGNNQNTAFSPIDVDEQHKNLQQQLAQLQQLQFNNKFCFENNFPFFNLMNSLQNNGTAAGATSTTYTGANAAIGGPISNSTTSNSSSNESPTEGLTIDVSKLVNFLSMSAGAATSRNTTSTTVSGATSAGGVLNAANIGAAAMGAAGANPITNNGMTTHITPTDCSPTDSDINAFNMQFFQNQVLNFQQNNAQQHSSSPNNTFGTNSGVGIGTMNVQSLVEHQENSKMVHRGDNSSYQFHHNMQQQQMQGTNGYQQFNYNQNNGGNTNHMNHNRSGCRDNQHQMHNNYRGGSRSNYHSRNPSRSGEQQGCSSSEQPMYNQHREKSVTYWKNKQKENGQGGNMQTSNINRGGCGTNQNSTGGSCAAPGFINNQQQNQTTTNYDTFNGNNSGSGYNNDQNYNNNQQNQYNNSDMQNNINHNRWNTRPGGNQGDNGNNNNWGTMMNNNNSWNNITNQNNSYGNQNHNPNQQQQFHQNDFSVKKYQELLQKSYHSIVPASKNFNPSTDLPKDGRYSLQKKPTYSKQSFHSKNTTASYNGSGMGGDHGGDQHQPGHQNYNGNNSHQPKRFVCVFWISECTTSDNSYNHGAASYKQHYGFGNNKEQNLDFVVVKRILGKHGNNMRSIFEETGCKVRLRGRGSGFLEGPDRKESTEPLQLHVSCLENFEKYQQAVEMVTNLLTDIYDGYKRFCKRHSLPIPTGEDLQVRMEEVRRDDLKQANQAAQVQIPVAQQGVVQ
ncbi:unnamed protein product [Amoebophrya sp. A120]|nr:unnamed protein product [Amoebophrya sp. A120]|eukprot:GSA120T00013181001.1